MAKVHRCPRVNMSPYQYVIPLTCDPARVQLWRRHWRCYPARRWTRTDSCIDHPAWPDLQTPVLQICRVNQPREIRDLFYSYNIFTDFLQGCVCVHVDLSVDVHTSSQEWNDKFAHLRCWGFCLCRCRT